MKILSLFDGISCGMVALERVGIPVERYVAYEIESNAIKISKKNYPQIEHYGDVTTADFTQYKGFDLLIGGSPCQDISNLNSSGKGLQGKKSRLFYEYLRALEEVKPKWFLFENVLGRKDATNEITRLLGVEPIKINSSLVSGQNRNRLYWTNIPGVTQPDNKDVRLVDILQSFEEAENYILKDSRLKWLMSESGQKSIAKRFTSLDAEQAQCLTARSELSWNCNYVTQNGFIRNLTPIEYERLQTLPDNYTLCCDVDERYRYSTLGNGWTVDVIAHILKNLK